MYDLADKIILFLYCMLSLMFTPVSTEFIIACFSAVIIISLNYALQDTFFPFLSCLVYGAFALFVPALTLFLPVAVYDFHIPEVTKYWMSQNQDSIFSVRLQALSPLRFRAAQLSALAAWLLSAAGLYRYWKRNTLILFLIIGCVLALLLHLRTMKYHLLHQRFQKNRDDGTELQLLLEEKNRSLRAQQNSEIYAATLQERNRIAREIHDNVGHMLTRSILMVGALKVLNKADVLTQPLEQLEDTLNQAMNNIRQSVHDLHDSSVNLQDTLQTLIRDFSHCPVVLSYEMSYEIPRDVKYSFIAVVKEALVNISRHSNASRASITVIEHPAFYQLIIQDNGTNGRKMDDSSSSEAGHGIGLINMENRIRELNGTILFSTEKGFRIYITVPKD